MSRIVGQPISPPPPNTPALEPDLRGATTVREPREKHRSVASCAQCHSKMDPPGFALENFDVIGGWRERYRSVGVGEPVQGIGHDGLRYHFSLGPEVDPSGELPGGQTFRDVRELKRGLLRDEAQLARNLARQLTVFATGAPVRFSDRRAVEKMVNTTRRGGYGVKSLVHAVVQSELFLNK